MVRYRPLPHLEVEGSRGSRIERHSSSNSNLSHLSRQIENIKRSKYLICKGSTWIELLFCHYEDTHHIPSKNQFAKEAEEGNIKYVYEEKIAVKHLGCNTDISIQTDLS